MRPWIPMLAVLAGGVASLGCSSVDVAAIPSPDAGADAAIQVGPLPNGTFRCDGEHAQQLDVTSGQWVDAGDCALQGGSGSVLHWSHGAAARGSAVLPGEGITEKHRLVAGAWNDVWWVTRRHDVSAEHARLFHWDGTWWTELYDWARFLPSGVVSDVAGGAWVFGQRQITSSVGTTDLVPSVLHVAPTRDRWDEVLLFGSTDVENGPSGLVVDMAATSDGAVWAVGQRPIVGDGIVMRRTGSVWKEIPYSGDVPSSIWAESATDAWVTTSGMGVFHWDGVGWKNTWRAYGTAPGRAAGLGWLTSGYHWDGTSWIAPDPSFPGGFDVAYVRPYNVGFVSPNAPEMFGIFAVDDRASRKTHSELWAYDGARWTKETSGIATGIEAAGGTLTSVAGDSVADLWVAPVWSYAP